MSALRCPQCGLVNFADTPACKRCKYPIGDPPPAATHATYAAQAAYTPQPGGFQSSWSAPNGYAPPRQEHYARNDYHAQHEDAPPGVWRDGKLLVMMEDAVLPDRCVRCNAPAHEQLKRKLEWYPRYIIYVFLFIRLLGLILYLLKRKRATIYIGMCQAHMLKRRNGRLLGGAFVALGFFLGFLTAVTGDFTALGVGCVAMLVGLIIIVAMTQTVTADKIDEPYIWVKGVHKDYLKSLPSLS